MPLYRDPQNENLYHVEKVQTCSGPAALMYDAKAFELRGDKARLNFPH